MVNTRMLESVAFIGDIHFPYEDADAVATTLKILQTEQPNKLYIMGDILDFYQLSKFDKDPNRILDIQNDLDKAKEFFRTLRSVLPDTTIHYIEGNHELRLTRYLHSNPEIANLSCLQLPSLLNLEQYGIIFVSINELHIYKGVVITHGEKCTVNSCKDNMFKFGGSGVTGHTHRLNMYHKQDNFSNTSWFEAGCLCSMNVPYVQGLPNWQHGMIMGYFDDDTFVSIDVIHYRTTQTIYNGVVYGY